MIQNLLSYYPKYMYLDNVLKESGKDKLKIYVDVKNCYQALYMEEVIKEIIKSSKESRHIDVNIFTSFLEFVSFHKSYAKKRNVELEMIFFLDFGKSDYHLQISKDYKKRRRVTDLFGMGVETTDFFYTVINKNFRLVENIGNKLPGVNVVTLTFLESDFVPYYIINRIQSDTENYCHVIYSNDKDFGQCLDKPNIFQFVKKRGIISILNKSNIWKDFFKIEENIDTDISYFPLFHAIDGDEGDDVKGLKGISKKTILKMVPELNCFLVGKTMTEVYECVKNKKPIFNKNYIPKLAAINRLYENEIQIIRNLKLVSFYLLSEFFDSQINTELIKKTAELKNLITEGRPRIRNSGVIYDSFNKIGITLDLQESILHNLFT